MGIYCIFLILGTASFFYHQPDYKVAGFRSWVVEFEGQGLRPQTKVQGPGFQCLGFRV